MDIATSFLRSLDVVTSLNGNARLSADQVRGLGTAHGLSDSDILVLVEGLKKEGALELHWGGEVSLTVQGRDRAAGKVQPAGGNIYNLGANAIFASGTSGPVGHGAGAIDSTVAVGGTAAGQNAVLLTAAAGDLAAALQILRQHQAKLPTSVKPQADELERELKATVQAVQQPAPDKPAVEQHLSRVRTLVSDLGGIAEAGAKLKPVWTLIGTATDTVGKWLSGS
jgi:hypothetical protein